MEDKQKSRRMIDIVEDWTTEAGLRAVVVRILDPDTQRFNWMLANPDHESLTEGERELVQSINELHSYLPNRPSTPHIWYCGYVLVPPDHPLFGVHYRDRCDFIEPPLEAEMGARGVIDVFLAAMSSKDDVDALRTPAFALDVHGSLTFSGPGTEEYPIPSTEEERERRWWFGFDCHHADDNPHDQDEVYTKQECERLAEQLAAMKHS